jgi:hypothetical protein
MIAPMNIGDKVILCINFNKIIQIGTWDNSGDSHKTPWESRFPGGQQQQSPLYTYINIING